MLIWDASGKVDGNDLTILAINFGRNTRFERYSSRTRYVPGQVIVKFYADITSSNRQDVLKQHGTHVLEDHPKLGVTLLSVPAYMNEMELIVELEQDPNVEYAELNQLYFARYVPNDPYYPFQWHFCPNRHGIRLGHQPGRQQQCNGGGIGYRGGL